MSIRLNSYKNLICGFPGVGKTYIKKKFVNGDIFKVSDSDSSLYSWKIEDDTGIKIRDLDFPNNYIEHINSILNEDSNGIRRVVLASTHDTFLNKIAANINIEKEDVYIVYPKNTAEMKNIYLERYKNRGSSDDFIKLISNNWDNFINSLEFIHKTYGFNKHILTLDNPFLHIV